MNTQNHKHLHKHLLLALSAAATLGASVPALAQSQGDILVRIGLTDVTPKVQSGALSAPTLPNTRIDVTGDTVMGGGVTYMLTDHWSIDLPLALPLRNRIKGADAIGGSGEIGYTQTLPATLFGQYRFLDATSRWRPYVGLGLTYASFYGETGNDTLTGLTNPGGPPTGLRIKDKFALTAQAGLTYAFSPRCFLEFMAAKTKLKTRSTLSTGQTIDVTLDPLTMGLYLGWKY
jgi:outer membrane protein